MIDLKKQAENLYQEAVSLRRHFHELPELSFQEHQTSAFIKEYLEGLDLEVTANIAGTGVVGFLNANQKHTLLIRADMDALPMEETAKTDYASRHPGVMHACGHDAHMAVVLATAKLLCEEKDKLNCNVLFLFQPGEEDTGGADPMIQTGILERYFVTGAIGLHVMNDVEAGCILVKKGAMMASPDDFDLTICGKGGHGAYPHLCVDPISISAKIIADFQTIAARTTSPFAQKVISVCAVNGGNFYNIIPDHVHLRGTVRTYDEAVRKHIPKQMEQVIKSACEAFGATYDFQYHFRFPPLINHEGATETLARVAETVLGAERILYGTEPSMAGDDFAYFGKAVPSVYFYLGTGNKEQNITQPLHSSLFEIDERGLKTGIEILAAYALDFS